MMISHFDRVENTVGKGENAGYRSFAKPYSLGSLKFRILWWRVKGMNLLCTKCRNSSYIEFESVCTQSFIVIGMIELVF